MRACCSGWRARRPCVHQLSLLAGVAVIEAIDGRGRPPDRGPQAQVAQRCLDRRGQVCGHPAREPVGGRRQGGRRRDRRRHQPGLASREPRPRHDRSCRAWGRRGARGDAGRAGAAPCSAGSTCGRAARGFPEVRRAWLAPAARSARASSPIPGASASPAAFSASTTGGALLLRDAQGAERRLTFGDVTLARGQPAAERA